MDTTINAPASRTVIARYKQSLRDPLPWLGAGVLFLLFGLPATLGMFWGLYHLVFGRGDFGIAMTGFSLVGLAVTVALCGLIVGSFYAAARKLEWLLGQGASQIEWLYIRRVVQQVRQPAFGAPQPDLVRGYDVVAVLARRKRVAIRVFQEAEAVAVMAEIVARAPQARIDHDGSLIAAGLGDRGFGYSENMGQPKASTTS